MNKKFTITLPWTYNSCNTDEDWFCIMATLYYVRDLLKVYGKISLNEVLNAFHIDKRYSYRWGYDLSKGDLVEVKIIKNPVNPETPIYLKFTARDIVG